MAIIPDLHANLFSVTLEIQKGSQVTLDSKEWILKKNYAKIRFVEKMENTSGKGFLLTTKIYNNPNNAALLGPKKQNKEGMADVEIEETYPNEQGKKIK